MINHFVVPGGGLDFNGEQAALGPYSEARAMHMVTVYREDRVRLVPGKSHIICAGRHQSLPPDVEEPDEAHREGSLLADFLVRKGVPHYLVEKETESTSTLTNAVGVIRILGSEALQGEAHIEIVSHLSHARRLELAFKKLGVPETEIGRGNSLPETGKMWLYELGLRNIFRGATIGARTERQLVRRDQSLEAVHDFAARSMMRTKNLLRAA